jgi:putative transposase
MRHRLYYHIAWTTRYRASLIDAGVASFLEQHTAMVARQERASVVAFGAVADHVHLLLRAHPTTDLPRLVQRLKGASARIATKLGVASALGALKWAKGYNMETVGPRALDAARRYVLNQAQRHPRKAIDGVPVR